MKNSTNPEPIKAEHVLTFDENGNIPVWDDLARNALKDILEDDMETLEEEDRGIRAPRPILHLGKPATSCDDVPCG